MRLEAAQIKALRISPSIFGRMVKWGWINTHGYPFRWFDHQGPNHAEKFLEEKEPKPRKKKFSKEKKEEPR